MDTGKDIHENSLKPAEFEIKSGRAEASAGGGLQAAETGSSEELYIKPEKKQTSEPEGGRKQRLDKAEAADKQDKKQTSEANKESAPEPKNERASKPAEEQQTSEPEQELYSVDWISLLLVIICLINIFYWYRNLEVVKTTDSRVFLAYPVENGFKNVDSRSSVHEGVLPPAPAPKEETVRIDNNIRGADGRLSDGLPHYEGSSGYEAGQSDNGEVVSEDVVNSRKRPPGSGD